MIPRKWRPELRRRWKQLDRAFDRRTLTEAELRSLLESIGITTDAVIMVHSSMDEVSRRIPGVSAMTLIRMLMEMVGPAGTILMPSFPFQGKQLRYVERQTTFDARRTPSQVGLITEVFRRMPGVFRSLHPTHSITAWGKYAEALTSTHHFGGTFDAKSPIFKLTDYGGLIVGLGTGLRDSFTILHVAEELHPEARERFFEKETRTMTIVNGTEKFDYSFRVLRADVRRDYDRVERTLLREGILRYLSSGGLRCAVAEADPFIRLSMQMVDEGKYL